MTISCVIASYGAHRWRQLALDRALPSTDGQGFHEVVVRHDDSATLAQTRNAAAHAATGEWLLFLDADDELASGFGQAMSEAIKAEPANGLLLFTPAVCYTQGRRRPPARVWPRIDLRDGNYLVIGTLISRDLFETVGGFHEWKLYEDWCLWQRASRQGAEVVEVPDAVYVAHVDPRSRNRQPGRREREEIHHLIRRANYPELYEGKA